MTALGCMSLNRVGRRKMAGSEMRCAGRSHRRADRTGPGEASAPIAPLTIGRLAPCLWTDYSRVADGACFERGNARPAWSALRTSRCAEEPSVEGRRPRHDAGEAAVERAISRGRSSRARKGRPTVPAVPCVIEGRRRHERTQGTNGPGTRRPPEPGAGQTAADGPRMSQNCVGVCRSCREDGCIEEARPGAEPDIGGHPSAGWPVPRHVVISRCRSVVGASAAHGAVRWMASRVGPAGERLVELAARVAHRPGWHGVSRRRAFAAPRRSSVDRRLEPADNDAAIPVRRCGGCSGVLLSARRCAWIGSLGDRWGLGLGVGADSRRLRRKWAAGVARISGGCSGAQRRGAGPPASSPLAISAASRPSGLFHQPTEGVSICGTASTFGRVGTWRVRSTERRWSGAPAHARRDGMLVTPLGPPSSGLLAVEPLCGVAPRTRPYRLAGVVWRGRERGRGNG